MARDEGVLVSISPDAHVELEFDNLKYGIGQVAHEGRCVEHPAAVRADADQHTLIARHAAIGVRRVEPLKMRVELEKGAARASALRIMAWTYCEIALRLV